MIYYKYSKRETQTEIKNRKEMIIMKKETMYANLKAMEDKLCDVIPEEETTTSRAKVLDKVSNFITGIKADLSNVTLADMTAVFNEGKALLAVEAEVKKAEKKAKAEEEQTEEKPKAKKTMKKKSAPKTEEEESAVVEDSKGNAPVKKSAPKKTKKAETVEDDTEEFKFPEVLETEDSGNFKMSEVKNLTDIEENDLIACKWTKADLAEWEYDERGFVGQPTEFEQDIDVCLVVSSSDKLVYAISVGTEKMYAFFKEDLKKMISSGMPWRVYKSVA